MYWTKKQKGEFGGAGRNRTADKGSVGFSLSYLGTFWTASPYCFGVIRGQFMQRILHRECDIGLSMKNQYSTREAAKKLGIAHVTLQKHVALKTFVPPPIVKVGGVSVRL